MRKLFQILIATACLNCFAESVGRKPAQQDSACRRKVEALIRSTARAMGLKQEFGMQLSQESAGQDIMNRPLSTFSSGVFIIPDGFVSNSGATVTVRTQSCDVIKLSVSVGG